MGNDLLIAGPWIGEFGWELMSWQGYIRLLSRDYKNTICYGDINHISIYSDFISDFIHVDLDYNRRNYWKVKENKNIIIQTIQKCKEYCNRYSGTFIKSKPFGFIPINNQYFIKFGNASKAIKKYDILLHIRKKNDNRDWTLKMAEDISNNLRKKNLIVGCIGSKDKSESTRTTDDIRGIDLKDLMNIISASKVVIGPSSGPMHLASLCGTKHIVWTDNKYHKTIKGTNKQRYEYIWNPFKTNVKVINISSLSSSLTDEFFCTHF